MAATGETKGSCTPLGNIDLKHDKEILKFNENRRSGSGTHEEVINPSEDLISPLEKDGGGEFPSSTHTRKRSVLKREDRPRVPGTHQKRVSFSAGPSERRVSNGMLYYYLLSFQYSFMFLRKCVFRHAAPLPSFSFGNSN